MNPSVSSAHPPDDAPARIVLMGAESTGKTTLCRALAAAYSTVWVPEYGRQLTEEKNGDISYSDHLRIAQRHVELEDEVMAEARRFLFVDTSAITTALYSYFYYQACDPRLLEMVRACRARYAHTIVCQPSIPFEADGWRGPEALRTVQQGATLMQLDLLGIPYTCVEGTVAERVRQVKAVLGK
ncbi:AAA family ATPase [Hymenobacter caeli]|uniref:NadR type nicotinamide-nucleotide adenylyltransferase n=1 Tax=Hymenobacter caeli TaxID=2735894 RepID=A0ABX2FL10_9BACT|nr:ATP-binding protein [Hymenobacter caeli]NRT17813.1 NadR type nicotinamide-nucleotide adenylyltransferase [Hymenobacter caeli]